MDAVVTYGSLINQEQLCAKSHLLAEACPVVVKGYRRVFNQEPSWREGHHKHRAVLNVIQSDGDYFNGLLVNLQNSDNFYELDKRERGYDRVPISPSHVIYPGNRRRLVCSERPLEHVYIYFGKLEKRNNNILPNKTYLDLCLRGARHWGEEFYEQFLQTTYVGRYTLKTFLQSDILQDEP